MITFHEKILQYIFQEKITCDNCLDYREKLLSFFESEKECDAFIEKYLTKITVMHMEDFVREGQRVDAFPLVLHQADWIVTHDFFELKYVLRGKASCIMENQAFLLEESDICIIRPYCHQQIYMFDEDCMIIVLPLQPDAIQELFPRLFREENILADFFLDSSGSTGGFLKIPTGHDTQIRDTIQAVYQYFRQESDHSISGDSLQEIRLEYVLTKVLSQHLHCMESEKSQISTNHTVYQMLSYMQDSLRDITLEKLASHFGYSLSYTSRFIRTHTGMKFVNILQSMRMEAAAGLLQKTDKNLDEIITEVGYSGRANFYENFQKRYNMTPMQYRKTSA